MNQLDCLESQLREWKPRLPSPELKKRIFGAAEPVEQPVSFFLGDVWRWLLPVMGCFVLVLASITPQNSQSAYLSSVTNNLFVQSDSQAPHVFAASAAEHSEQNNVPHTKLEWSFGSRASSAAVQTIQFYTNKLIQ